MMDSYTASTHYLLLFFLASSYLHTSNLCFCLGDELPTSVNSCIDEERRALVSFKEDIVDPSGRLSSWVGYDCCQWRGISCNSSTGHVEKMDLRNAYKSPSGVEEWEDPAYESSCFGGKISPSLVTLNHLYYLDLSRSRFVGIQIPMFFGKLKNLSYLNLSSAFLGGEIPPSLGNLSNLNYLDLNRNSDLYSTNLNWLSHLSSLKYLNLGEVDLSNTGISWLPAVNTFPSLLELHLSSCKVTGSLPLSLPAMNFKSLLILDLSGNFLNSSIPGWLFNLTSLRKLYLSGNSFSGPFPGKVGDLKSLEVLDLSAMGLEGQIPKLIGNLCNLKILNLAGNRFDRGFEELLNGFSYCTSNSLESLDVSSNSLASELPTSLGMLKSLQHLDLTSNNLWGSIPESIGNLSSLKTLYLFANQMNGSIPESFGQLSKLVHLDLSSNSWEGMLTEAHMINLTSVEYLALDTDRPMSLIFNVSYEWIPPFKLHTIQIRDCHVGSFGVWLQSQTKLEDVTLHNTRISDSIPNEWFLKISSQVEFLDLSYNQIRGKLPFHLKFPKLRAIYLSHNQFEGSLPLWSTNASLLGLESNSFSGPIPSNFDQLFPNMGELYLSNNHLNGTIPPSICNIQNLAIFSARSNELSGEFPQAWSLWPQIKIVDVGNNNLSGNIPTSMGVPKSVLMLIMNNNNFGGKIPSSLKNCSFMRIDLGGNRFTGEIPSWIGNRTGLSMLRLRSNFLAGHIPHQLCYLTDLRILDLGRNNFSGTIPKCLNNLTFLTFRDSHQTDYIYTGESTMMDLKGSELEYKISTLYLVKSIDLSSNNLEGRIPEQISSLVGLGTLNLSMNRLSGNIPTKIGNLRWLETLDLSHNLISGQIPQSLSSLTFLSHMNLSYNNLTGRIPSGNQLQTLDDPSVYKGNPTLCGFPLNKCVGDDMPTKQTFPAYDNKDNEDDNGKLGFYISAVLGFVIGFWGVYGTLLLKKSWRYAYFQLFDNIKDKVALAIALKVTRYLREV